ncbi:ABC transporter ATP-binding protein [Microbacterium cremeum]|uniref:ABC transporter ATP-binding protein n=1 Tax=Microbacterium cremeum TaxID=2782169 RepID=UPI001889279E|nr:ABC transporter ATP-binding protein [Microbacterium cremeum]
MTLRMTGVSKSFGTETVLSDVDVELPTGHRLALVGESGSGKSTLLRLLMGFERPDRGTIELDGRLLSGPGTHVPTHRRGLGYVPQDGALFPHLSVARNIAFGLARGTPARGRVRELMELTALAPALADRMPHELSGGQQQRVALARALAPRPRVILLDEPFSALDTGLRAHTRESVVEILEATGVTAVLVTHDQEEALSFGVQVGVLEGQRLVQSGPPADVFDAPVDAAVAAFLGDVVILDATRTAAGAACALGVLPVRHDLAPGDTTVRAMVRPAQITITPADAGNARVLQVRTIGAGVDVRLALESDDSRTELVHRVPAHQAARLAPGSRADVAVDGGVVLYPAVRAD